MNTRTYTSNYSTYANDNAIMKRIVNDLALRNGVSVSYIDSKLAKTIERDRGFYSVIGVYIDKGELLIYEESVQYFQLALHELLHILSVPQHLRHLMDQDTQDSYKTIKKKFKYKDVKNLCTESAVLGAQYIICMYYNYACSIQGQFFTGIIYNPDEPTDVKPEWIKRGKLLLDSIFWK